MISSFRRHTWRRVRWLLGYDDMPLMARPTFRYELISSVFAAIGSGVIITQFTTLFARRTLQANELVVGFLVSVMAAGNLTGVFLGQYLRRRRRVPFVVAARLLIAAVLVGMALLPARPASQYVFAGLLVVPAMAAAVALNVRSSVWHSNFPADARGRIFSRLHVIRLATTVVVLKLCGYALDAWPWAHHMLYPLASSSMVAAALIYGRIRVRGESGMLRATAEERPGMLTGLSVLWTDRRYGLFMLWQMISGGMVLMTVPVVTLVLTDHFQVRYAEGTTALVLVPMLVCLCTAPLAGRWFDRVGVTRFRAVGALFWASSRALLFVAAWQNNWTLVLVAAGLQGLGQAPGGVAFSLGHTRFAPPSRGQLYMGVHMTLQGVRGVLFPLLGGFLYGRLGASGHWVLLGGAAVQGMAVVGFLCIRPPEPEAADEDRDPLDEAT